MIVKRARTLAGLTQAQLAARLGTTQTAISRREADKFSPTVRQLREEVEACGYGLWIAISVHGPGGAPDVSRSD